MANILLLPVDVGVLPQGGHVNECLPTTFKAAKEENFCGWFRFSFFVFRFFKFFVHGLKNIL